MTSPTVYLEASIGAPSIPWFTLNDTSRGKLDTGKLADDYFSLGHFTNLSTRAFSIDSKRGRQRLLERAGAGTLSAVLANDDRALDPTNTAGAYVSNGVSLIQPMRTSRLRAEWGNEAVDFPGTSSDYLSTPHDADYATTDLYIEWVGSLNWKGTSTETLAGKWGTAGNRSWRLRFVSGNIELEWSTNGTASVAETLDLVSTGFNAGQTIIIQVSLDTASPYNSGNYLVVGQGSSLDGLETNTDSASGGSSTTVHNASSTALTLGAHNSGTNPLDGTISQFYLYARKVRSTGASGSETPDWTDRPRFVAQFDARWFYSGATTIKSYSTNETWTVNGTITLAGGVTAYPLWQGYADDWQINWADPQDSVATLTATDGFKLLARVDNNAIGSAGAGETTGERITRVLDAAGWPTEDRDLDDDLTTVQATTLAQNALTEVYLTADTEYGDVYVDEVGRVAFRDRHTRLTDPRGRQAAWVFGDNDDGIEIPYSELVISTNDDLVYNSVSIARVGGSAQVVEDDTSISEHLTRTFTRTDLTMQTDTVALDYASTVLAASKDSDLRFDALTIESTSESGDRMWPVILGAKIGDRVTVRRRPPGGGSTIERDCYIEGIAHSIRPPTVWATTFQLSDASHQVGFILDDTEFGELDDDTLFF